MHLTLPIPDATTMGAYLARPSGPGPHPGLLVIQEAFGVNAQIRRVTDRFATQGFVAISPEMFHRTVPPCFEGGEATSPRSARTSRR